jgi:MFS superfamily sulfate permease-like transporter
VSAPDELRSRAGGLRFDRMEWAGAFGDLGTLVPFVLAYLSQVGLDPSGMLFAVGVSAIATGLLYRTPFPVQPMKVIGVAATAQGAMVTPSAIFAAGLVTGLIWLVVGLTGLTRRLTGLVARPVLVGLILGLGLAFMIKGVGMMGSGWLTGTLALAVALLLRNSRALPAMFALLALGIGASLWQQPGLVGELAAVRPDPRLPPWSLPSLSWDAVAVGVLFLALPQLPLTLGNAVLAVTAENNRLFPDRATSHRRVALSTGIINLLSPLSGGVPLCHGAGGLAAHVRFGARTGGAPVIIGGLLLVLALVFGDAVRLVLGLFPEAVLGVMLVLAGAQLAISAVRRGIRRGEGLVLSVTAAAAVWNVGAAFALGLALHALLGRRRARSAR